MAGRRKDPADRARTNPENRPFHIMGVEKAPAPELPPSFRVLMDGRLVRIKYPPETRTWWDHWVNSPLNGGFTTHDWDYLLITAGIHARVVLGIDSRGAAELRQREAKYGATPEDRAKLRIVTVNADTAEEQSRLAAERNAKVPMTGEVRRLTAI